MAEATDPAHGMEYGKYYVVEASFDASNPVARYVAYAASEDGCARLMGGGRDDQGFVRLADLPFFQMVGEVTTLSDRSSRFMPDGQGTPLPAGRATADAGDDMAAALRGLLEWKDRMGGWDAPCWKVARALMRRVDHAARPEGGPRHDAPPVRDQMDMAASQQGWNDHSVAEVLAGFVSNEAEADPSVAERLETYLAERLEEENSMDIGI